jgi:hypothetical protein
MPGSRFEKALLAGIQLKVDTCDNEISAGTCLAYGRCAAIAGCLFGQLFLNYPFLNKLDLGRCANY